MWSNHLIHNIYDMSVLACLLCASSKGTLSHILQTYIIESKMPRNIPIKPCSIKLSGLNGCKLLQRNHYLALPGFMPSGLKGFLWVINPYNLHLSRLIWLMWKTTWQAVNCLSTCLCLSKCKDPIWSPWAVAFALFSSVIGREKEKKGPKSMNLFFFLNLPRHTENPRRDRHQWI